MNSVVVPHSVLCPLAFRRVALNFEKITNDTGNKAALSGR